MQDFRPRLILRKDKKRKRDGRMPLCVLFSFPRTRGKKVALGFHFAQDEWNKLENLPYDNTQKAIVSAELQRIKNKIAAMQLNGEKITKEILGDIARNSHLKNPMDKDFMEFFEKEFLKKKKTRVRQSTFKSYLNTFNVLCDFIREYRHNQPIKYKDINIELIESLLKFLKERSIKNGKEVKNLTYPHYCHKINEVINEIRNQGINIINPFGKIGIQIQSGETNEVYLHPNEILKFRAISTVKSLPKIEKTVIDMLLISCCTGLRISDIKNLRWENIVREKDFDNCVLVTRCKKTDKINYVPSSPMLRDILIGIIKDRGEVRVDDNIFPEAFSQTILLHHLHKVNDYLKINKKITFHAGRRTFATLSQHYEIDFYLTKRILGHKITDMTEKYIKWDAFRASQKKYYLEKFDFLKIGNNE